MRNRTDTRSLGRPPIGGVPAGNLSMTVASSPLALRTGSARLHRHPVLQPTDQVIRKRDFLLDPYLLRRTRTAAHTAQRRQMNTPGVLPSSATAARGRPRPQHPHITSSAGWTARRSSGFTGGPPAAFRPWVTRPDLPRSGTTGTRTRLGVPICERIQAIHQHRRGPPELRRLRLLRRRNQDVLYRVMGAG